MNGVRVDYATLTKLRKLLRRLSYASRSKYTWHIPAGIRKEAKALLKEIYGKA